MHRISTIQILSGSQLAVVKSVKKTNPYCEVFQ